MKIVCISVIVVFGVLLTSSSVAMDKPYLKTYPVLIDSELAFDVMGIMHEGRTDVRMQQDPRTGSITLYGRDEDHQLFVATLNSMPKADGGFAIIPLTNADPSKVIKLLQNLHRLTGEESEGPKLMANQQLNHILIRGTPQQVTNIKNLVATLDPIAPLIGDSLQQSDRLNLIDIILPKTWNCQIWTLWARSWVERN